MGPLIKCDCLLLLWPAPLQHAPDSQQRLLLRRLLLLLLRILQGQPCLGVLLLLPLLSTQASRSTISRHVNGGRIM